jgi:hypothetical protein
LIRLLNPLLQTQNVRDQLCALFIGFLLLPFFFHTNKPLRKTQQSRHRKLGWLGLGRGACKTTTASVPHRSHRSKPNKKEEQHHAKSKNKHVEISQLQTNAAEMDVSRSFVSVL